MVSVRQKTIAFNATLAQLLPGESELRCEVLPDHEERQVAFRFGTFKTGFKVTPDGPSSRGVKVSCHKLLLEMPWLRRERREVRYDVSRDLWVFKSEAAVIL